MKCVWEVDAREAHRYSFSVTTVDLKLCSQLKQEQDPQVRACGGRVGQAR